jgi:hypothetical protein
MGYPATSIGYLYWMLVAEDIDSLQSSSLDGINKMIP